MLRFQPSLACGLLFIALANSLVGCQREVDAVGKQLLVDGQQRYWAKQYPEAEEKFNQFLLQYEKSYAAGEAYYLRGLSRLHQSKIDEARADLEHAGGSSIPQVRSLAYAALGNLAFESDQDQAAIVYYERALNDLKREAPMDKVLFRLGVALQRQGAWDQAQRYFSKLMYWFKDSDMVTEARRRYAARSFSIQCGAFADARNANRQAQMLRNKGFPVEEKLLLQNRKTLHVVLVGKYPDYAAAKADEARIAVHFQPTRIVP